MANNGSDGSIIIDTELDNAGFEKGSDKLLGCVKDLTAAVDTLGDNMMASFQSMTPLLQSIAANTAQIYAAMTSEGQQAVNTTDAVTEAVGRQAGATETATADLSRLQSGVASVDRDAAALDKSLGKLESSMKNGFSNAGAVLRFKDELDEAEKRAATLRSRLDELGKTRIPTAEYTNLTTALSTAEQKLLSLYDRQEKMQSTGTKTNSKQWRALAFDIQKAEAEVARYEAGIAALETSGGAFTNGVDTEQYKALNAQLQDANDQINRGKALIDAEAIAQAQLNVQAAQEAVIRAASAKERAAAQEQLRAAQAELNALAGQSSAAGQVQEESSRWSAFGGILRGVGQALQTVKGAAVKTAGAFAKMGVKALASGFDKLKKKLQSFSKAGKQTTLTSNGLVKALTSIKTMLKSRVKRMFISYLMSEIKAAMSALVKFSSAFNASVSGMRNSTSELGGNIAVTFSNLVNAVAPAITTIINLLSTATSYLNAFFAMLGGKSTVTKKQTDDYAKSLGGAAGAAKDLDKANKTLGIDELNVVSEDKDSGGGGKSPADLYEDVSIDKLLPEDVSAWFDSIKAALEAGDWYGIGKIISGGLNVGMTAVDDWINGTLRPLATTWAGRIAQLLNGLVDGLDWKQVGKTLADGANVVIEGLHTLLSGFNFGNLGKGIGEGLAGIVENLDTERLGSIFAYKVKAILDGAAGIINGFADQGGFATLGTKLAENLNGWLSTIWTIDWSSVGAAVGNAITGLPQTIINFLRDVDWKGHAQGLSTSIINLCSGIAEKFKNYDWRQMGRDLIHNLVTAIGDFFGNIDWSGVADAAFDLIGAFVGGVAAAVVGLGETLWNDCIKPAWDALVKWWNETAFENGEFTIQGLLNGIWEGIKNIGVWIYEHIFKPFIDGFKAAFGIASPSKVMAEQGGYIISGLLQGITNAWTAITGFFSTALSTLKTTLSNAWTAIKTTAGTAWENLKTTVTTKFNNAKAALSTTATAIQTGLSNAWENAKATASEKWENIKSNVSTAFENTRTALSTTAENVKSALSLAWDSVKTTASTKWEGIKSSVSTTFTNLKTGLSTTAENIKSTISTAWDNVKTTASTKWENIKTTVSTLWNGLKTDMGKLDWTDTGKNLVGGVKKGIQNAWDAFKKWVTDTFNSVTSTVKAAFGIKSPSRVFAEIGEYLDEGLVVGLKAGQGDMLSTVKNIAGSVTDTMNDAHPELEIATNATVSNLEAVAGILSNIAQTFATITGVLTSMGGLQVPAIAAGTVAPYQTRVAQESPQTGTEGLNTVISEGNAELLAAIAALADRVVAAIQENGGDLYIGDEQIVRSYDRGDTARGVRVSRGAFANVY